MTTSTTGAAASVLPVAAFERALAFVLHHEGGGRITDDPRDPGGLTKWGISQRACPGLDIRSLTRDAAAARVASNSIEAAIAAAETAADVLAIDITAG